MTLLFGSLNLWGRPLAPFIANGATDTVPKVGVQVLGIKAGGMTYE